MKTKAIIAGTALTLALSCFIFSSFSADKPRNYSGGNNYEEINKVQSFVWDNICNILEDSLKTKHKGASSKQFSRCPSGYNPHITTKREHVKKDGFVNGEIVYYKGCSPVYVCEFKVCVSKGYAVLRSKGTTEYLSVSEWVRQQNQKRVLVKG